MAYETAAPLIQQHGILFTNDLRSDYSNCMQ